MTGVRKRFSVPLIMPEGWWGVVEGEFSMRYLLDQIAVSAYISDEKMNVLAWNGLADVVFGAFESSHSHGSNLELFA